MSIPNMSFKYFEELDDDLKNYVLSKVRNPQNKNLLDDIVNYNKTKKMIYEIYEGWGLEYTDDLTDEFNIHAWVENDLMSFYNDNIPLIDNITENNLKKIEKIKAFQVKIEKNKSTALYNIMFNMNLNPINRINNLIGCLTINERNKFIEHIKNSS
jgi:hypothetical protein